MAHLPSQERAGFSLGAKVISMFVTHVFMRVSHATAHTFGTRTSALRVELAEHRHRPWIGLMCAVWFHVSGCKTHFVSVGWPKLIATLRP